MTSSAVLEGVHRTPLRRPAEGLRQPHGRALEPEAPPRRVRSRGWRHSAATRPRSRRARPASRFNYRLDTSGGSLHRRLSSRSHRAATPPSFAGNAPITFAHSQSRPGRDVLRVGRAAHQPGQLRERSSSARPAIRKKTGTDLNSLLKLFTGDLIVAQRHEDDDRPRAGQRPGRREDDAVEADERTVAACSARGRRSRARATSTQSRTRTARRCCSGSSATSSSSARPVPAALAAFATTPATPASGAQGTVAFRVALVDLLRLTMSSRCRPRSRRSSTRWATSPGGLPRARTA